MLRDQTPSLSGVNDALSADIISPCALTYEIFGKMVREALEKLETREMGSIRGVRVLQSMLHNMKSVLAGDASAEDTTSEKQALPLIERKALTLIERAVCEASGVVDDVVLHVGRAFGVEAPAMRDVDAGRDRGGDCGRAPGDAAHCDLAGARGDEQHGAEGRRRSDPAGVGRPARAGAVAGDFKDQPEEYDRYE